MRRINPGVCVTDWTVHENDFIVPTAVKMDDNVLTTIKHRDPWSTSSEQKAATILFFVFAVVVSQ